MGIKFRSIFIKIFFSYDNYNMLTDYMYGRDYYHVIRGGFYHIIKGDVTTITCLLKASYIPFKI